MANRKKIDIFNTSLIIILNVAYSQHCRIIRE